MSTHNIGFYEDLTKIIFKLSSNIIKYAPYFFCWAPNKTIAEFANTVDPDNESSYLDLQCLPSSL